MNTDRIREIQGKTAYPNSKSVQQALLQVWHEIVCDEKTVKTEEPKQEWEDDLPPVGCDCEMNIIRVNDHYERVVIEAYSQDKSHVMVRYIGGEEEVTTTWEMKVTKFRPLQTKDTEREEAVKDIENILNNTCYDNEANAGIIYDAGFRKVKELSDEEIKEMASEYDSLIQRLWIRLGATQARNRILGKDNG